ncbi:hypothetical protein ACQ86G_28070 [Roseateles chitinivorans]|uniref:hypothetical protein n=1 Tax=Roseateles chitinivorans TaxID=2917965 RepID=UPI003D679A01
MRIPSRRMPKASPESPSGWPRVASSLVMWGIPLTLTAWYLWRLVEAPVAVLTGTVVIAGASAAWYFGWGRPQLKRTAAALRGLAAARAAQSICEFSRDFDLRAVDSWVVRAVYEALQDEMAVVHGLKDFPIRADDRMVADLRIDPEELDLDIVERVANRACRSLDDWTANPFRDKTDTVRGLVLFLNAQPLVRPKAAA